MIGKFDSVGTVAKVCTAEIVTEAIIPTDHRLRYNQATEEPVIQ